jgi:hypothetical protein
MPNFSRLSHQVQIARGNGAILTGQVERPTYQLWATATLQGGHLSQKGKLLEGNGPQPISTRTSHRPDQIKLAATATNASCMEFF